MPLTIAIAATFTSEPVEDSLAFWLEKIGSKADIKFAPYNQVFQQLLDSASLFNRNINGVNIVLVRFEDWQRFDIGSKNENDRIEQNLNEFVRIFKSAILPTSTPCLICICPPSPAVLGDLSRKDFFSQAEEQLVHLLSEDSNIYIVKSQEIATTYPVEKYYDAYANAQGHIPYTPVFFAALATMLARKIYALKSKPRKVIVLDCDQTLWNGICGEDGPLGVILDQPYLYLQEFMTKQQANGRLLCLCSKNSEPDVWEVFTQRDEMILKRTHIVASRINWKPKSENLYELAQELNLGLDSFILVDDNPLECSEVRVNCPEVEVLQLPEDPRRIPGFLAHTWAFDQLKITQEDRKRTELYHQNTEREQIRKRSQTMDDFLAGLELEVEISKISVDQFERVAQLTQRTNQFNLKTTRRNAQEILSLQESGKLACEVVVARDRFGDYGLIGAMMFGKKDDLLDVDTFLLSCRALGRGIENHMLARLMDIAKKNKQTHVNFSYHTSPKNQPILDFLRNIGADFEEATQIGADFCLPVEFINTKSLIPSPKLNILDIHTD